MQEKSRILVFTTAYRPMIGGSELALEEIIRRLPDVFFDIITSRYKRDFKILETGTNFNLHRVGVGAGIIDKITFPIFGFLKASVLTRDNNYNAVHAYQASYGGGAAWLLKIIHPRLPFILTMQEGKNLNKQPFLLNWLRRLIIKKADIITVISSYLAEYVKKTAKNKKVFLIPNGVDLNKFIISSDKLQINFGLGAQKENRVITVSRLVPKNGVGDLIKAFHILITNYQLPTTQLLIIGDGPLRGNYQSQITDYQLQNKVKLLGQVPPDKTPEYLANADVFVRPSLSEGLGTAFLEAMASGVPIIGTPVGGIPDFLENEVTGLFCKPGDPGDIADKIKTVLTDDNLREKLIVNGRKLVEEKYNWDKITEKFKKIYEGV